MIDENYKKISKIVSKRYQYNDRIMNTLLETSIFREELLKKDTKQQLPVIAYLNSEYDETDVCAGVPAILGKNGLEKIID